MAMSSYAICLPTRFEIYIWSPVLFSKLLLNVSTWMRHRHFKFKLFKWASWSVHSMQLPHFQRHIGGGSSHHSATWESRHLLSSSESSREHEGRVSWERHAQWQGSGSVANPGTPIHRLHARGQVKPQILLFNHLYQEDDCIRTYLTQTF